MGNKPIRVLAIEDNIHLSALYDTELQIAGYAPTIANSAEAALKYIEQQEYDAALLDLHLPGMSGAELFGHLRKSKPDLPILIVTGATETEDAISYIYRGALSYIIKDDSLVDNIKTVLNRNIKSKMRSKPYREQDREVLIVDDDREYLKMMQTILEVDEKYTVHTANTYRDAIRAIYDNNIGVAIIDKNMPGDLSSLPESKTGENLARYICGMCPFVPVVLNSGNYDAQERLRLFQQSLADFVVTKGKYDEHDIVKQAFTKRYEKLDLYKGLGQPQMFSVSGPSGSGKCTICYMISKLLPGSQWPPRYTTRKPRPLEAGTFIHPIFGRDHKFVSKEYMHRHEDEFAILVQHRENETVGLKTSHLDGFSKGNDVIVTAANLQFIGKLREKYPFMKSVLLMAPEQVLYERKKERDNVVGKDLEERLRASVKRDREKFLSERLMFDYTVANYIEHSIPENDKKSYAHELAFQQILDVMNTTRNIISLIMEERGKTAILNGLNTPRQSSPR